MITSDDKDVNIIAHILEYCKRIENGFIRFGNSYDDFMSDDIFRDAVSMAEFQIGELSIHLSDEFKEQHKSDIPWQQVRAMRNLFAHNYIGMDTQKIWSVATADIPVLRKFCEECLGEVHRQAPTEFKEQKPSVLKQIEELKQQTPVPDKPIEHNKAKNDPEL